MRHVTVSMLSALVLTALTGLYAGCSSSGGSDSPEGPGETCVERCEAIAQQCGNNPGQCPTICQTATEQELSCMETTNCDSAAYQTCVNAAPAEDIGGGGQDLGRQPGEDLSAQPCSEECDFSYCDEALGECVNCLDNSHCTDAYDGPTCIFPGTIDATCGCDTSAECTGHPSGGTCHDQYACSCSDDFECANSGQGSRCVSVLPAVGLSQCGCEDAATDCAAGLSCLSNKCM